MRSPRRSARSDAAQGFDVDRDVPHHPFLNGHPDPVLDEEITQRRAVD
ncbi:MAG: hypothetical protein Q8P38_07440 [Candidatus Nanopelagicales bacterium]|nr:hypothetical protein [Candidatus Nanopelagicales bacterium]